MGGDQCCFNSPDFVVYARRYFSINGGRILSFVVGRFKGLGKEGGCVVFNAGRSVQAVMLFCGAQDRVFAARVEAYVRINGGSSYKCVLVCVNEGHNGGVTVLIRDGVLRTWEFRLYFRVFDGCRLLQDAKNGPYQFVELYVRTCMLWRSICWDRIVWLRIVGCGLVICDTMGMGGRP